MNLTNNRLTSRRGVALAAWLGLVALDLAAGVRIPMGQAGHSPTLGRSRLDLGPLSAGEGVISPDGKYLFFTAGERGKGNIYWVEAAFLKK